MFQTFATSCFREILAAKNWKYVSEKMAGKFRLNMHDFHVAFRDLLRAVNLRHGTGLLLLPLGRKACRGFFFALKNPTASAGFEPRELGF
jgi:hypothetical protein